MTFIDTIKEQKQPFESKPHCELDDRVFLTLAELPFTNIIPSVEEYNRTGRTVTVSQAINTFLANSKELSRSMAMRQRKKKRGVFKTNPKTFCSNGKGGYIPLSANDIGSLKAIANSPRYKNLEISCYRDTYEKNKISGISMLTAFLPNGNIAVAYGGTGDEIKRWSDCVACGLATESESQTEAVKYLKDVNDAVSKRIGAFGIHLSGYSKGGHMALYAAMKTTVEIRKKIKTLLLNDFPGFHKNVLKDKTNIKIVDDLIRTLGNNMKLYCPSHRVISNILRHFPAIEKDGRM